MLWPVHIYSADATQLDPTVELGRVGVVGVKWLLASVELASASLFIATVNVRLRDKIGLEPYRFKPNSYRRRRRDSVSPQFYKFI